MTLTTLETCDDQKQNLLTTIASEKYIINQNNDLDAQNLGGLKLNPNLADSKKYSSMSNILPTRPEFPVRFVAKPFVHYGNTVKVATMKQKQIKQLIKQNDNRMKQYVAMLESNKETGTSKILISKKRVDSKSSNMYAVNEEIKSSGLAIIDDIQQPSVEDTSGLNLNPVALYSKDEYGKINIETKGTLIQSYKA